MPDVNISMVIRPDTYLTLPPSLQGSLTELGIFEGKAKNTCKLDVHSGAKCAFKKSRAPRAHVASKPPVKLSYPKYGSNATRFKYRVFLYRAVQLQLQTDFRDQGNSESSSTVAAAAATTKTTMRIDPGAVGFRIETRRSF